MAAYRLRVNMTGTKTRLVEKGTVFNSQEELNEVFTESELENVKPYLDKIEAPPKPVRPSPVRSKPVSKKRKKGQ